MKMGPPLEPWQRKKSNHLLPKLIISLLLIAITFHLFFSHNDPIQSLSVPSEAAAKGGKLQRGSPSADKFGNKDTVVNTEYSQKGKCNLFTGEWIHNPSGPSYTNASCPFIEAPQNCMTNGRPDTDYLYWRWKPHDCDIASFDASKFLDVMRNKSWGLIGDSIFRNHAHSLLCLLIQVEKPIEVYHDKSYKSRKWHFPSHNFTLSLVWAPFLVKADIFEDDEGKSTSEPQLHLDTLDSIWTSQYETFDYIIISGGQWFLKHTMYMENNAVIGCHYCHIKNVPDLKFEYTYSKALKQVFDFVAASKHKPVVIYRTWTPDHFEYGEWFSGGTCNRTLPYKEGVYNGVELDRIMRRIELEEFNKVAVSEPRLKLLDTFNLSLMRPDGHPGPYRNFHPFDKGEAITNDCLHWCLPGPVEAWNDLIMEMMLNE